MSARGENWRSIPAEKLPVTLVGMTVDEKYAISAETLADIQLAALKLRVERLASKIPVVRKLAGEQHISTIETIADAAPLLLRNSVYKSYPLRVIETGRFDQLTKWLGKLTVHDLSAINTADCRSIDEWIDRIAIHSDIRVIHSSGTSGKLSFLPRSQREIALQVEAFRHLGEGFGSEPDAGPIADLADMPLIFPSFRHGATESSRLQDGLVHHLYGGDEHKIIALHEGRMSADALSLVGRINKGTADPAKIRATTSPEILARFDELRASNVDAAGRMKSFVANKLAGLEGRRVVFLGSRNMFYDTAREGERLGIRKLFARGSIIAIGGGNKGRELPDDAMSIICRFLGVERVDGIYGLSECIALTRNCPEGNYHIQPWIVPFLLDPLTGQQFPRTGTHTGHLGLFDLLPSTYWGGFLTGDKVTLSWGDADPCACGRVGAFLHPEIRRYSEEEGGDDKITCAGTPDAHNRAIEFVTSFE